MPNTGFLGWAYISGSTVDIAGGLSDKQVNFMSGSTISGSSNATFDYATNTLSASVVSGTFWGSGANLTSIPAGSPGGSDTQMQFNDGGSTFEGASAVTYNKTTTGLTITGDITASAVISSSANISGSAFYGDGSNLSGVSASPDGSDTQVQFNDGGSAFGGDSGFTYNKTTNALTVVGDITSSGVISSSANISGSAFYGAVYPSDTYDMDIMFNGGGKLSGSAALTFDHASETLTIAGPISANVTTGDITLATTGLGEINAENGVAITSANAGVALTSTTALTLTSDNDVVEIAANGAGASIMLNSPVLASTNITASGHVSSSAFYGDGSNLSGISAGSPAGSDTEVQFNDGGSFSGSSGMVFNKTSNVLSVTGDITSSANISASIFYGSGAGITGVTAAPAGSTTELQFNDGGTTGASADLTYNDTTNTLVLTGTLISTGSVAQGYVFSLSGSTYNSTFGSFIKGDYALIGDGNVGILIDAGITSGADATIVAANGNASMVAGGYGGNPKDLIGASLTVGGGMAGSVNTIGTYNDAGIDVHSANILSLSGSAIHLTASTLIVTSALGTSNLSVLGDITSSTNISASAFFGDGSGLTGVGGGGSPDGSNTQIQFNNAGAFGSSADLTYNDTTNTLVLTGTLIATSSAPGYVFSLSGSTIDSSFGGGLIGAKYALKTNNDILIDAGDVAGVNGDIFLAAKTGQVYALGGNQTDMLVINSNGSSAGSVNTIRTLSGAGIDVHSANTLSLSGSAIHLTASTLIVTSALGTSNLNVLGDITSSTNISASAFYGDGSNLSGIGGGSAAGSDTYIQFNDGGSSFGGEANFTFNKATDVFNVSGSTRITGGLDQGNNSAGNYFKLSSAYSTALTVPSGEFFHLASAQALVIGEVYYLSGTANPVVQLTASAVGGGAASMLGLAVGTALATDGLLLRGFYTFSGTATGSISGAITAGAFEEGKQIYASEVTAGYLTTTQPSTAGNVVRVLGHAVTTTMMYFNPSPDFVTV